MRRRAAATRLGGGRHRMVPTAARSPWQATVRLDTINAYQLFLFEGQLLNSHGARRTPPP